MTWPGDFIDKVVCGDAIETMRQIPGGVVQCCVTSPPYWGLRDYGLEPTIWGGDGCQYHDWALFLRPGNTWGEPNKNVPGQVQKNAETNMSVVKAQDQAFCRKCNAWRGNLGLEPTPEMYVEHLVEVFREVRRVLKDDGTLWLNLGDSYWGPQGRGSGKGNEHNQKIKQSGGDFLKPKDLCMIPARVALALQADGWWLRSVIIWHKPSCMPESVTDRPTTSHEYVYLLAKSADYYYDADAIRERTGNELTWEEYNSKPKIDWMNVDKTASGRQGKNQPIRSGRNKRTVWTINPEPTPYAHFATFPQKLVEPCIMAGTSEKGNCGKCGKPWVRVVDYEAQYDKREPCHAPHSAPTKVDSTGWKPAKRNSRGWQPSCECGVDPVPAIVIDPFSGSGTVGVVAKRLQRKHILIDLNPKYNKIAVDRLAQREMVL